MNREVISFIIPFEPKTKKNSNRICRTKNGKIFVRPSKQFEEYQSKCRMYIPTLTKPIDYQINIKAVYYMQTRRKVDITNLHNALHDILVHYGLIADDNMRIVLATDGSRVKYDKEHPRTEIYITKIQEETGF